MFRDNKKDILLGSKSINLISDINILIVGGGRAAEIKLKSFTGRGFSIVLVAPQFTGEIHRIASMDSNVNLKKRSFVDSDIETAHMVFIGTDDDILNEKIALSCREQNKLYLYMPNFKYGNISVPYEVESKELKCSISTRKGSPKTCKFLGQKIEELLWNYDDFVGYICGVRDKIKDSQKKREIMDFINTDEFYEYYRAGYGNLILKAFYGGDIFEKGSCD